MVFTPDLPFLKTRGHVILSKDWNDAITELRRLGTDKVNKAGDDITGSLTIAGNVGIGTTSPQRPLQVGTDVGGVGLQASDASPNAGYVRWGDNTGWKLHFGRSRERSGGPLNTGTTGVLMTIQDNGNVGVGTTTPRAKLQVRSLAAIDEGGSWANFGSNAFYDGAWKRIDPARAGANLHMNPDGGGQEFRFQRVEADGSRQRNIATIGSITSFIAEGNVGIGTMGPLYKLHAVGPGGFGVEDSNGVSQAGSAPIVAQSNSTAIGIINADGRQAFALNIDSNAGTNNARGVPTFYDKYDGNWHQCLSLRNGNVGIGTTSPQRALSVNSALNVDQANANDDAVNPGITFGSSSGEGIASKRTAGGNQWGLDLYTASSPRLSITNGGNVIIGPGINNGRLKTRHIDGKHHQNDNNDPLFINYDTGQPVWLGFGGQPVSLFVSGNVGIGTRDPQRRLHVLGNRIRIDNGGGRTLDLRADGSALDLESNGADLFINSNNNLVHIRNLVRDSSRDLKER